MSARQKPSGITQRTRMKPNVPLLLLDDAYVRWFGEVLAEHANGGSIPTVIGLFSEPSDTPGVDRRLRSNGHVLGDVDPSDGDRDMLKRWLSKFPDPTPQILRDIANQAEKIEVSSVSIVAPVRGRNIDVYAELHLWSPMTAATLGYMVAAILSNGYSRNLRQCKDCKNWFFDVPSKRPMRKFCHSPCDGNAFRQAELRERLNKHRRGRQ